MSAVKIKLCGLSRACDIDCVNRLRPDYIGFVFAPNSRRYVSPETARRLKERLDPEIPAVGVFVDERPEQILALAREGVIDLIQLHGREDESTLRRLKAESGLPVIRSVSVGRESPDDYADSAADFLLFDNGAGGTGAAFDWTRPLVCEKPFFLAGGLSAANVRAGVERFHPYAVDVSGGAETDGVKDPAKIEEIIRRVRDE